MVKQLECAGALLFEVEPPHNNSLDASGGGVFRIIIGPAILD
jgi:hypothetical protein